MGSLTEAKFAVKEIVRELVETTESVGLVGQVK